MFLRACFGGLSLETPTSQREAISQVKRKVRRLVERDQVLPGIQHVVVDAKETISEVHLGVLDKGGDKLESIDSKSNFMAYSITKVITSVAVFQLVQKNLLDLDVPLSAYYSNHPYGDTITIHMLLNHTAGIPNPIPADWFVGDNTSGNKHDDKLSLDREQALQGILQKHPKLSFEPGSSHGYSNIGYWLLEKVVESVSGDPFDEYVQKHIFKPLSITGASFSLPSSANVARGHMRKYSLMNAVFRFLAPADYWIEASEDGKWSRFVHLHHLGMGYGGLYASAGALATILQDLLKKDSVLLQPETKDLFFADGGWVSGTTESHNVYGLRTTLPYYSKPGGGLGFHGNVRIYPSIGIASVFLANASEVTPGPILSRASSLDQPFVDWQAKASLL